MSREYYLITSQDRLFGVFLIALGETLPLPRILKRPANTNKDVAAAQFQQPYTPSSVLSHPSLLTTAVRSQ